MSKIYKVGIGDKMVGKKLPNSVSIRGGQRRSMPRTGRHTSNKVNPGSAVFESCDTVVTTPKPRFNLRVSPVSRGREVVSHRRGPDMKKQNGAGGSCQRQYAGAFKKNRAKSAKK
jgi:hypothetical protein